MHLRCHSLLQLARLRGQMRQLRAKIGKGSGVSIAAGRWAAQQGQQQNDHRGQPGNQDADDDDVSGCHRVPSGLKLL